MLRIIYNSIGKYYLLENTLGIELKMQFFHEWEQLRKQNFFLIELNIFMDFNQILLQEAFMAFIDI